MFGQRTLLIALFIVPALNSCTNHIGSPGVKHYRTPHRKFLICSKRGTIWREKQENVIFFSGMILSDIQKYGYHESCDHTLINAMQNDRKGLKCKYRLRLPYENEYSHVPDHCKTCVVLLKVIQQKESPFVFYSSHESNQTYYQDKMTEKVKGWNR